MAEETILNIKIKIESAKVEEFIKKIEGTVKDTTAKITSMTKETETELDKVVESIGKKVGTKIKPKVDLTDVQKDFHEMTRNVSNALAAALTTAIVFSVKQSIEETKDIIIAQGTLTNLFQDTSISVLDFTTRLQYLSGQAIPSLTNQLKNSFQYFDNINDAMVSTHLATMVASTGMADFATVVRNLGAASRGMLSPILSKFFGRAIGIAFTDAEGNAISFGETIRLLDEKFGQLADSIKATPWWVFTQLKLQTLEFLRALERPIIENFANSLRGIVDLMAIFNQKLSLSSKYIGSINKMEIISRPFKIDIPTATKIKLEDIRTQINDLYKLEAENTTESIKKAKELRYEIASQLDNLSKRNHSVSEFKDSMGEALDISELTAEEFQSILDSVSSMGGDFDRLINQLDEAEATSKRIRDLLTIGLVAALPSLGAGIGAIFSKIPGLKNLATIFKLPFKGISALFAKITAAFAGTGKASLSIASKIGASFKVWGPIAAIIAIVIELFHLFKHNVDGVTSSLRIFMEPLIILRGLISQTFGDLKKKIAPLIDFGAAMDQVHSVLARTIKTLVYGITGIVEGFLGAVAFISGDIPRAKGILGRAWRNFLKAGYNLIEGLSKGLFYLGWLPISFIAKGLDKGFVYVSTKLKFGLERIKIYLKHYAAMAIGKDSEKELLTKLEDLGKKEAKALEDGFDFLDRAFYEVDEKIKGALDKGSNSAKKYLEDHGVSVVETIDGVGADIADALREKMAERIWRAEQNDEPIYKKVSNELNSLWQQFYDKLAGVTLPPHILNLYNIGKDISRFSILVTKGLITPIELATLAFKSLKAQAFEALHATYYGLKENPLTKELQHIEQMTAKQINIKQTLEIILSSAGIELKTGKIKDADWDVIIHKILPYIKLLYEGKITGSQILNYSLGSTTSP